MTRRERKHAHGQSLPHPTAVAGEAAPDLVEQAAVDVEDDLQMRGRSASNHGSGRPIPRVVTTTATSGSVDSISSSLLRRKLSAAQ
jgi:hypothetical protein